VDGRDKRGHDEEDDGNLLYAGGRGLSPQRIDQ
jgi:hypothetical protein